MQLGKNITIVDLALVIETTLVIGDLHIGLEEALNRQGIMMPRFQFPDIMKRLEKILKKVKINTIVINGDLTHEFGRILDQEWRDTLKLLDYLAKFGKVILIKGNHDTYLKPIADKRSVEILPHYQVGDVFITHGDRIPKLPKCKAIVIGHEHAAIGLQQGAQREIFKCFLVGTYQRKQLIVMPSLSQVNEGTDVLDGERQSPFVPKNINSFRIYVVEDKVYDFGKIKGLT